MSDESRESSDVAVPCFLGQLGKALPAFPQQESVSDLCINCSVALLSV